MAMYLSGHPPMSLCNCAAALVVLFWLNNLSLSLSLFCSILLMPSIRIYFLSLHLADVDVWERAHYWWRSGSQWTLSFTGASVGQMHTYIVCALFRLSPHVARDACYRKARAKSHIAAVVWCSVLFCSFVRNRIFTIAYRIRGTILCINAIFLADIFYVKYVIGTASL